MRVLDLLPPHVSIVEGDSALAALGLADANGKSAEVWRAMIDAILAEGGRDG